jgi:hypothetical protein
LDTVRLHCNVRNVPTNQQDGHMIKRIGGHPSSPANIRVPCSRRRDYRSSRCSVSRTLSTVLRKNFYFHGTT